MIWPEIAIKKAYRERLPIAFDAFVCIIIICQLQPFVSNDLVQI